MKLLDASAYLGFASTVPEQAAMKSGVILKLAEKLLFRTTLAIWRKERFELFCARPELMSIAF